MDENAFYNLFTPNASQENYLYVSGGKFKVDSFLSYTLSYKKKEVSCVCECIINDETLGKWLRLGKIEAAQSGYNYTFNLKIVTTKDKKEFKLSKINKKVDVKTKAYAISLKDTSKIKVKVIIPTATVEKIIEEQTSINTDWSNKKNNKKIKRADILDFED